MLRFIFSIKWNFLLFVCFGNERERKVSSQQILPSTQWQIPSTTDSFLSLRTTCQGLKLLCRGIDKGEIWEKQLWKQKCICHTLYDRAPPLSDSEMQLGSNILFLYFYLESYFTSQLSFCWVSLRSPSSYFLPFFPALYPQWPHSLLNWSLGIETAQKERFGSTIQVCVHDGCLEGLDVFYFSSWQSQCRSFLLNE